MLMAFSDSFCPEYANPDTRCAMSLKSSAPVSSIRSPLTVPMETGVSNSAVSRYVAVTTISSM